MGDSDLAPAPMEVNTGQPHLTGLQELAVHFLTGLRIGSRPHSVARDDPGPALAPLEADQVAPAVGDQRQAKLEVLGPGL